MFSAIVYCESSLKIDSYVPLYYSYRDPSKVASFLVQQVEIYMFVEKQHVPGEQGKCIHFLKYRAKKLSDRFGKLQNCCLAEGLTRF